MKTLFMKRALMAGAALSLMNLPVGAMAPAFAQEEEAVEEWSEDDMEVETEVEAAAPEEIAAESPAETETESDETGAVLTAEDPPAAEGAVPLSDEDGGSRAKSGPPT